MTLVSVSAVVVAVVAASSVCTRCGKGTVAVDVGSCFLLQVRAGEMEGSRGGGIGCGSDGGEGGGAVGLVAALVPGIVDDLLTLKSVVSERRRREKYLVRVCIHIINKRIYISLLRNALMKPTTNTF